MSQLITATVRSLIDAALPSMYNSGNSLADILYQICADNDSQNSILAANDSLAYDIENTSGLDFYYKAGIINQFNTVTAIAAGYVTVTANQTNYVECNPNTGAVTSNTSSFTATNIPLFIVVAGSSSISSVTDRRAFIGIPKDGGLSTAMLADLAVTAAKIAAGTITGPKFATAVAVRLPDITFTLGAEAANARQVTLTAKDSGAASLSSQQKVFEIWIADSATGGLCSSAPDGGVSVTTGTILQTIVSNKHYKIISDATGVIVFTVTESTAKSFYVRVAGGDHPQTSAILTFS